MAVVSKEDILETIENMKLLEIKELVDAMEEKFGVSAAPVAAAAAPGAAAAAEPVEEKTEFDVILKSFDAAAKIKVIKVVRSLTSLNLKEAKELVEGAPKEVVKDMPKDEAEKAKKDLEEAGAQVELK